MRELRSHSMTRRPGCRRRVRRKVADIEHRMQQFRLGQDGLRLRDH